MYEFSLASYLVVFGKTLAESEKSQVVTTRVQNIIDQLTKDIYDYTCTGIFEKHKLMYSIQMCALIMKGADNMHRASLDFFLKGDVSLEAVSQENPAEWIPNRGWKDLVKLNTMTFPEIVVEEAAKIESADGEEGGFRLEE